MNNSKTIILKNCFSCKSVKHSSNFHCLILFGQCMLNQHLVHNSNFGIHLSKNTSNHLTFKIFYGMMVQGFIIDNKDRIGKRRSHHNKPCRGGTSPEE